MKHGALAVMALAVGMCLTGSGLAQDRVEMTATPVSVFLDQKSRSFCVELRAAPDDRMYLVCDDATAKTIVEELFALGKKGESCRVVGQTAGRSGDSQRLVVTEIHPAAQGAP